MPGDSRRWNSREVSLLGTGTDISVARKIGRSEEAVRRKRKESGIPSKSLYRFTPTERQKEILGKLPDSYLGRRWGVTRLTILKSRRALGLAACRLPPNSVSGDADAIELLLGEVSDRTISEEFGDKIQTIRNRRNRLGKRNKKKEWSTEEASLLGTDSDTNVGKKIGRSTTSVRTKRIGLKIPAYPSKTLNTTPRREWTRKEIAILGTASDRVIGEKIGRSPLSVTLKRLNLKINAYRRGGRKKKKFVLHSQEFFSGSEVALFGTDTDRSVAKKIGRKTRAVSQARIARKIPCHAKSTRKIEWGPSDVAILGKFPDREVARILGISKSAATKKRISLGIDPANGRGGST